MNFFGESLLIRILMTSSQKILTLVANKSKL